MKLESFEACAFVEKKELDVSGRGKRERGVKKERDASKLSNWPIRSAALTSSSRFETN